MTIEFEPTTSGGLKLKSSGTLAGPETNSVTGRSPFVLFRQRERWYVPATPSVTTLVLTERLTLVSGTAKKFTPTQFETTEIGFSQPRFVNAYPYFVASRVMSLVKPVRTKTPSLSVNDDTYPFILVMPLSTRTPSIGSS